MAFNQWSVCAAGLLLIGSCQPTPQETEGGESRFSGSQFSEHIRTTQARTPEEERLGFKLPEGFEIQLYASEPDIGKPLNIAFDEKGRLWVTQSHEYPFPAEPGKGADRLSILEDTDGDGQADTFTHYKDTLNIPIGLLPVNDGAIAYSIPNLYRFADINGDDTADKSKVLFGQFGFKDTHGMVNNLTRGYDGWVYTCHGFTNTSTIAGSDGDSISMTSGNTFRFMPDGSRVEQTTFGQVNPFGLAFDAWGYMYSTDCHTSPIYQLIRGADYPHFGKKEVGIGFAPDTKPHGEESTALSGLALYDADQFPEEYRNDFYIGDVVSCRVHRNSFRFEGSTPIATAEEDFVKSEDPWFRPVDIKLGPDGALYIADFYNSIIGHYEVPLDHPKRDKVRGRIWRISYTGTKEKAQNINLSELETDALITTLSHQNISVRMSAADQLVERVGESAIPPLQKLLEKEDTEANAYALALWILHRIGSLSEVNIKAAILHENTLVRTHTLRILREIEDEAFTYHPVVKDALLDDDLHVQRAAVETLTNYPTLETVELLLAQRSKIPDFDTHYLYTLRLSLRNLLREEAILQKVVSSKWNRPHQETLADVMIGVESTNAGRFMHQYLTSTARTVHLVRNFQHAVRFAPTTQLSSLFSLAKEKANNQLNMALQLFRAIHEGLVQRGTPEHPEMKSWGEALAKQVFTTYLKDQPENVATTASEITTGKREELQSALQIAEQYLLKTLTPEVKKLLEGVGTDDNLKAAAAQTLLNVAPESGVQAVQILLTGEEQPIAFKQKLLNKLNEVPAQTSISVLKDVKNWSPILQKDVAMLLAATPKGKKLLLDKVQEGEIFARALLDPKIKERILSDISAAGLNRYEQLSANVPPVNEERNALIADRLTNFEQSDSLIQSGVMVFNRNCKSCHRVSEEGGMIGPQLTGIGNWGAEALATKILDPNRNISEAFRTYTIKTKDGEVKTGLFRREEGAVLVFANMSGEEFSVAKDNINTQEASAYTLMPDHFGEALNQNDFNALLSYLLNLQ